MRIAQYVTGGLALSALRSHTLERGSSGFLRFSSLALPAIPNVPNLDVAATADPTRHDLTLFVVNRDWRLNPRLFLSRRRSIAKRGFWPGRPTTGCCWLLAGCRLPQTSPLASSTVCRLWCGNASFTEPCCSSSTSDPKVSTRSKEGAEPTKESQHELGHKPLYQGMWCPGHSRNPLIFSKGLSLWRHTTYVAFT